MLWIKNKIRYKNSFKYTILLNTYLGIWFSIKCVLIDVWNICGGNDFMEVTDCIGDESPR